MAANDHLRFHREHEHLQSTFGTGGFGSLAESIARFFGTPWYLLTQTLLVIVWITANVMGIVQFDLYPFILLNLAFSTQAAYAAPLILLAQTRQAERDKTTADADARHREDLNDQFLVLLRQNTELTEQVHRLTEEIHGRVVAAR